MPRGRRWGPERWLEKVWATAEAACLASGEAVWCWGSRWRQQQDLWSTQTSGASDLLCAVPTHCSTQHLLMLSALPLSELETVSRRVTPRVSEATGLYLKPSQADWSFKRGQMKTFLVAEFQTSAIRKWGCWRKQGASHNLTQRFSHSQEQRRQERQ